MKLDQIQIKTTDAKVNLHISDPVQHIEQPRAQQHIEQPAATLEIHSEAAKLFVDSSQAYRDLGLLTPKELGEQNAQIGKQKVMEGIARRASEGNQMMNITKSSGNVIQKIARSKSIPIPSQLGITWKPSIGSVKIRYQAGSLDINIHKHDPKIDVKIGKVVHDYTPGDVMGTLVQRPSVETTVIKAQ